MADRTTLEQFVATLNFFGNLQHLLTGPHRGGRVVLRFQGQPGIKDPIEAMGVPHTEVDVILANGRVTGFEYPLQPGDNIEIYPVSVPVRVAPRPALSPRPPHPVAFILDVHLGKLARRLRLLGFDCLYANHWHDTEIVSLAEQQERIILTRDRGLLKQRRVRHGYLVRSAAVTTQVKEVLDRYQLEGEVCLWQRCTLCNGLLERVEKAAIAERLQPKTLLYYDDFHRCTACNRVYWPGSHFAGLRQWLESVLPKAAPENHQPRQNT
jgi:uncharacterized protein with PIN domain